MAGLTLWAALFVVPLAVLYLGGGDRPSFDGEARALLARPSVVLSSLALAGTVAMLAVLLGYLPARLLHEASLCRTGGESRRAALVFLLLSPLVLPNYVGYYAWQLLLGPTTAMGAYVTSRPDLARVVGTAVPLVSVTLWYWPIAALLMAQGWRHVDADALECASLDAGGWTRLRAVVLPLLWRSAAMALAACFVLALSEYTAFHLAGLTTVQIALDALWSATNNPRGVALAAWPMIVPAALVAWGLDRACAPDRRDRTALAGDGGASLGVPADCPVAPAGQRQAWAWAFTIALFLLSLALPAGLLAAFVIDAQSLGRFFAIHGDKLAWSGGVSAASGVIATAVAGSALGVTRLAERARGRRRRALASLAGTMRITILMAMFLPPALVAAGMLRAMTWLAPVVDLRQSWVGLSAGLAVRYAALAMVLLSFLRRAQSRALAELAAVDGASAVQTWRHVHLPLTWPLPVGAVLLVAVFSMTEVPATIILLPPGLPSLSQWLLNQMHYGRDRDVVLSCLMLLAAYGGLALTAAGAWRMLAGRWSLRAARRALAGALLVAAVLFAGGCRGRDLGDRAPRIVAVIGRTGGGNGEFIYPRAIERAPDGTLWVADKTGRVQHLSAEGEFLGDFRMPQFQAGFPVGLTCDAEGNLWVADTHYHQVMAFSPDGRELRRFGGFGQEGGRFVYPTDVAFAGDGRIFVSEYGGNDRISVFRIEGERVVFVRSFGSPGEGEGRFSRPAAMAVDGRPRRLYVADACNHRLAMYDLSDGMERLLGYVGSPGSGPGEFRYPYGLALIADERGDSSPSGSELAVCEFGNNRVQVVRIEGLSATTLAVRGSAGRQPGELAYPWGVAMDDRGQAYVVDAGNNRIQVWRF